MYFSVPTSDSKEKTHHYSKKIDMDPCTYILTSINRNPLRTTKETENLSLVVSFSTFGRMLKKMGKGKEKEWF